MDDPFQLPIEFVIDLMSASLLFAFKQPTGSYGLLSQSWIYPILSP